jgi:hypothetical protein
MVSTKPNGCHSNWDHHPPPRHPHFPGIATLNIPPLGIEFTPPWIRNSDDQGDFESRWIQKITPRPLLPLQMPLGMNRFATDALVVP